MHGLRVLVANLAGAAVAAGEGAEALTNAAAGDGHESEATAKGKSCLGLHVPWPVHVVAALQNEHTG